VTLALFLSPAAVEQFKKIPFFWIFPGSAHFVLTGCQFKIVSGTIFPGLSSRIGRLSCTLTDNVIRFLRRTRTSYNPKNRLFASGLLRQLHGLHHQDLDTVLIIGLCCFGIFPEPDQCVTPVAQDNPLWKSISMSVKFTRTGRNIHVFLLQLKV
jgi:hypothetical protein